MLNKLFKFIKSGKFDKLLANQVYGKREIVTYHKGTQIFKMIQGREIAIICDEAHLCNLIVIKFTDNSYLNIYGNDYLQVNYIGDTIQQLEGYKIKKILHEISDINKIIILLSDLTYIEIISQHIDYSLLNVVGGVK